VCLAFLCRCISAVVQDFWEGRVIVSISVHLKPSYLKIGNSQITHTGVWQKASGCRARSMYDGGTAPCVTYVHEYIYTYMYMYIYTHTCIHMLYIIESVAIRKLIYIVDSVVFGQNMFLTKCVSMYTHISYHRVSSNLHIAMYPRFSSNLTK